MGSSQRTQKHYPLRCFSLEKYLHCNNRKRNKDFRTSNTDTAAKWILFSKSGPSYPSPTRPKSRLHSDVAPRLHRAADGGSPAQETHSFLSVFPSQNLRHEVADEFILDTRLFQKCFSTRLSNGTIIYIIHSGNQSWQ